MKWLSILCALLSLNIALSASAADPEAFEMLLTGKTAAGPNANEDFFIRKRIASFVEDLRVKKYLMRAKPVNGGFKVCIEPENELAHAYIVGELNTFAVRASIWDVQLVKSCR